jgi:hypothetical protein
MAPKNPVCLLQIAMRDEKGTEEVFLFDLLALKPSVYNDMLTDVFTATDVVKVGHGLRSDFDMLYASYPMASCFTHIHGVIEANDMMRCLVGHGPMLSLQKIVYFCLRQKLVKTQQTSNWNRRPLSPGQVSYAALDALVLLWIHDVLARYGASVEPHSINVLLQIQLTCGTCSGYFDSQHALVQHQATSASCSKALHMYACPTCSRRFGSAASAQKHEGHCKRKNNDRGAKVTKNETDNIYKRVKASCYCGREIWNSSKRHHHAPHYMCQAYQRYATWCSMRQCMLWTCVECRKEFESPENLLYHHGLCKSNHEVAVVEAPRSPRLYTQNHIRFQEDHGDLSFLPCPKQVSEACSNKRLKYGRTASEDFTYSPDEESLWSEVGKYSDDTSMYLVDASVVDMKN